MQLNCTADFLLPRLPRSCHRGPSLPLPGIFVAQLINYGTKEIYPWGWRLSLALGGVPGFLLFIGALVLPDTPNSLIERGKLELGEKVLQRIRGTKGRWGEGAGGCTAATCYGCKQIGCGSFGCGTQSQLDVLLEE